MTSSPKAGNIVDIKLVDALGERYLAYAMSTITSRSLPDVRDGLKPVHRRLLYAMYQLKLAPQSGFKKCARVVGDVIGKYHPHGDVAVYDAMVRLAQEFAVRYPLVDGQGNFGSIDGDNAAAMRYTEARLTEVALALLQGIDEDAVDFRETYDGEGSEPVVMPARFPNLLANGSAGIAVGMATSIPPHNAAELCDGLLHLIKFPNVGIDKLVDLIPGPDFPTGGILVEPRNSIIEAYRTGRGGFRLRARWEVEKLPHGLYQVVVTEIPYQAQLSKIIEKVADLLSDKKLPLLADIRDESAEQVRIVLEPKNRTVDANMMMEHMFRLSDLETRFSLNINVLDKNNTPRVMDLRQLLNAFLEHRLEVMERRNLYRLEKINHRLEVLGGLLCAFLNLDEIIRIIREEDQPKDELIKLFELSDIQAEAILNMRLRQLRKLEEDGINKENKSLKAERAEITSLLADEELRKKALAREIREIKKQFGNDPATGRRRTKITNPSSAVVVPLETIIEREPITVICSDMGWIRSIKGHIGDPGEIKYKEGDHDRFILHAQTTDKLVIFATNGRFYTLGCDKLPGGRGHGEPIRLMIEMTNGHDLVDMFVHRPDKKLLVCSESGRGFVVEQRDVIAQTRNGKQILNLAANEEAAICTPVIENADAVAIIGNNRKLLIFPYDELPVMGRGRGVILQRYRKGGISDAMTMVLEQGLTWRSGKRERNEKNLAAWLGKRAQSGHAAPRGFARSNRFS